MRKLRERVVRGWRGERDVSWVWNWNEGMKSRTSGRRETSEISKKKKLQTETLRWKKKIKLSIIWLWYELRMGKTSNRFGLLLYHLLIHLILIFRVKWRASLALFFHIYIYVERNEVIEVEVLLSLCTLKSDWRSRSIEKKNVGKSRNRIMTRLISILLPPLSDTMLMSHRYISDHGDPFGTRQSIKLLYPYLRWSSLVPSLICPAHKQRRWLITRTFHFCIFLLVFFFFFCRGHDHDEWAKLWPSEIDHYKDIFFNFSFGFFFREIKILKQHDVPLLLRYRRGAIADL